MQVERLERRLGPVAAGLARSVHPEMFQHALTLVEDAVDRFDDELAGVTQIAAPQEQGLQKLYREAGI